MCATKVEGEKNDHNVMLYTLSTCTWCQATKDYLEENSVEYAYINLDTCTPEERMAAGRTLTEKKAPIGFPVGIIDDDVVISGNDFDRYREVLSL
jgi:glutaredoxin